MKKRVAKKLHCQFGHSSAEKNKTIVKISLHIESGIKQDKSIERICVMPKIQKTKTKTKTTETNSRILFILRFQCYSNLFERNRQNIHLASH